MRRRFREPARGPQVVAEHDRVFRRELSFLVEHAQVGDGELVAAGGGVGDGARAPRHEQAGILREHARQLADGELGLRSRRGHPAIEPRQEPNRRPSDRAGRHRRDVPARPPLA